MVAGMVDDSERHGAAELSTTLVLALTAVGAALVAIFGSDGSFNGTTVLAAVLGLVPWALVAGGVHVGPVPFFLWSFACSAVIVIVDNNAGGLFPLMVALVWLMRATDDRRLIVAALVLTAALLVALAIDVGSDDAGLVYFLAGVGIAALMGRMLHRQERITAELRTMHGLRLEHAASGERARIARDVHDVVAHSLTVVMLHLTGARRALATDPAGADEALARAEEVGRESLDSIRQVMGLLREPGTGTDVPVPGIADLPALLDGYRAGGLDVVATVAALPGVDPTVGLVVYRVVQESLTNVLRHAPGAACTVDVAAAGGVVEVVVVNGPGAHAPADAAGDARTGLGVRGMVERVRALGGEVVAGPTPGGGWRVAATIRPAPAPGSEVAAPPSEAGERSSEVGSWSPADAR